VRAGLYLDEDVLPELARVLRSAGIDAVSAHEVGALGTSDEDQLLRAAADGRALLSLPLARDWAHAGRRHAGLILSYRQYRRRELRDLRRAIIRLLDSVPREQLDNAVYVLDQYR
jgi:hypothetical protein